ncbi:MAG TPA: hypothetical protein PK229_12135 [Rhodocyclaceae bacterium]|nr:hypothetical protein [Rhodocyclaceae bacterium]
MANAILWKDSFQTIGGTKVLGSELNSLANGSVSGLSGSGDGAAYDNGTNLYQYAAFRLNVTFGSTPSSGGYINVYEVIAPDGSTYGSSAAVVQMRFVCAIPVNASTSAQVLDSPIVFLRPAPGKYALENKSGVAFPSSGSSLYLYPNADEVQ